MTRAKGLSFYQPVSWALLYGIQLGSCMSALHLARSFIQCHLSPVRSVHHPDNFETPLSLSWLSRAGISCQFRCGCLTGPWGRLSNIWDTKYEMHSSLADIEPHAEIHSSNCHQCAVVVPTITPLEKWLHGSIRSCDWSLVIFESRTNLISMQENIDIDTKIIQIHQVHAFLWAKPFLTDAFSIHFEKWPPSWNLNVRQVF